MDVLSTKPISEKTASKILKKFVESKQGEENAELMMTDEVKTQLAQVLDHLQGKKPQIVQFQDDINYEE